MSENKFILDLKALLVENVLKRQTFLGFSKEPNTSVKRRKKVLKRSNSPQTTFSDEIPTSID